MHDLPCRFKGTFSQHAYNACVFRNCAFVLHCFCRADLCRHTRTVYRTVCSLLCACFKRTFPALPFSRDISLRKLELTESEIRVFGKTGKLLKTFPYSAVRELRVVTLMVGNFGGMYGKLKPENFICLSLDGQIPAPETRLTELYGSLDCLTFAYTKEAMTFLNQKIPPAV